MNTDHEPILINENDAELGGREQSIEKDFAYKNNVANAAVRVRMAFVRRVYGLLAFQLMLTVILGSVAIFIPQVQIYITNNDWIVMISFLGTFGILLTLFAYRKRHPHNILLLTAFTICEALMIGVIISKFDTLVVLQAVVLTFAVVMSLTLFTFQTKRDFSAMGAGLSASLIILLFGGIINLLIGGTQLEFLFAVGGAILFSLFIIYDTQMIMQRLSPEEYILATISLYLDIINLFLHILRILSEASRQ